jgi:hypothetical protein
MMRRLVTFSILTAFGGPLSGPSAPTGPAADFGAKYSFGPEQKMRIEEAAGGQVLLRTEAP